MANDSPDTPGDGDLPEGEHEDRERERRRLIDLTRRDKGLPERRQLGVDRRRKRPAPDDEAPPA